MLTKSNNKNYLGEVTRKKRFDDVIVGSTDYHSCTGDNAMHYHECPTVCFLLNGGGVEKRKRGEYERFAEDARFYHAAELHQSDIRVFPSKCINLELETAFFDRYDISENILNVAVSKNPDIKFMMLKIYGEFLATDPFSGSSVAISILGLLNNAETLSRQKRPGWIKHLHELLNDRWDENLGLDDLARTINVHPTTISKHFTRYFSCTFGEYMRKLKIEKSIALIRNTNLSLTEIAARCGFADQSHFIRNFKKLTGFLPKDFKRL